MAGAIYKVHGSEVDMWIVTANCLGMIAGTGNVFSWWQKSVKEEDD